MCDVVENQTFKEFAYDAKDIFDKSNTAKLKNEKKFDEAGKFLEQNKFPLAAVAATAEVGDTDKDRVLTEARAKVVRDYLVQHFKFDDTRLKIIGLGKSRGTETSKIEISSTTRSFAGTFRRNPAGSVFPHAPRRMIAREAIQLHCCCLTSPADVLAC
ncbi:MAG: OmpA family protein [Terriglobales bacterium]